MKVYVLELDNCESYEPSMMLLGIYPTGGARAAAQRRYAKLSGTDGHEHYRAFVHLDVEVGTDLAANGSPVRPLELRSAHRQGCGRVKSAGFLVRPATARKIKRKGHP